MRTFWRVALLGVVAGAVVECCREHPGAPVLLRPAGVAVHEAAPGYLLFAPLLSTTTYLIDRQGRVVHAWESGLPPGCAVYLLDNGHLLRAERDPDQGIFGGGGEGGRIVELDWDGRIVWEYTLASATMRQHHDIEPMPNGDVLMIAWERKSRGEALAAGRRLELAGEVGLLPDCIVEVRPTPPRGGEFVWEWHLWDHLVQDADPARANFGSVSEHAELIDANGGRGAGSVTDELLQRLRSLGYLAGGATAGDAEADLAHTNSVAYDPALDQIALSVNTFNEVWIIDHCTTRAEAAGHSGGRSGRGGDLLWRWGNPQAYGRGSAADQRLFGQHDARWIPPGYPGAGHLTVFNNGDGRPGGDSSSVLELELPEIVDGRYATGRGGRWGPVGPVWEYAAAEPRSLAADFLSGAQRLRNGNTLVCDGPAGRFLEVADDGAVVWEYVNPYTGDAANPHGDPRFSVFWATWVPPDHPGLAGRRLAPLEPQPRRWR